MLFSLLSYLSYMICQWIYAYCVNAFSRRTITLACEDNLGFLATARAKEQSGITALLRKGPGEAVADHVVPKYDVGL